MKDTISADAALSNLPVKKRRYFRWLAAAALLFLAWFCWQLLGPNPPIIISKDTTYITKPLRPDDLPDYERWLLEKYRAGITTENNAGVLLYQATWPGGLDPADYDLVCDELGLAEIPTTDGTLQEFLGDDLLAAVRAWLADRGVEADDQYAEEVLNAALDSAWTTADFPPLAAWIGANRKPLELVDEASRRSHYYLPSPSLLNNNHDMLIAMLLPGVEGARNAARALSVRAMWHLGEGRLDEAWSDTLALHRLACLAGQTHTVVENLVAISMHNMAGSATQAILSDPRLPFDLARQIQADLANLNCSASMQEALGTIERLSTLDSVVHMKLYGVGILSDEFARPQTEARYSKIDWNIVLIELNDWYDRLAQAFFIKDRVMRQRAFEQFTDDLNDNRRHFAEPTTALKAIVSRRVRAEIVASTMANLMLPALEAATSAEDRNNTRADLLDVAVALAVYRADHGQYPDKLDDLVADALPQLPVDLYHAKSFVYSPDANGYLLYSAGENGTDDGGSHEQWDILAGHALDFEDDPATEKLREQIPIGADDLSIRVPRPPFKLPAPPDSP